MRTAITIATACLTLAAGAVLAQEPPLSALETAVACQPPPTVDGPPAAALRVIGAQDPTARRLFGIRDLLVVGGGTKAGVQLAQEFFVRRPNRVGLPPGQVAATVDTVGWIRVVAVNETTAIAVVEHACDGIMADDYLEPFGAPRLPANADRNEPTGEPDFTSLARVLVGEKERRLAGAGGFMLIDRGSTEGVTVGKRLAVYRDVHIPGMPLNSIGEAVVVNVGPHASVTHITATRDAVQRGDYVAFRK